MDPILPQNIVAPPTGDITRYLVWVLGALCLAVVGALVYVIRNPRKGTERTAIERKPLSQDQIAELKRQLTTAVGDEFRTLQNQIDGIGKILSSTDGDGRLLILWQDDKIRLVLNMLHDLASNVAQMANGHSKLIKTLEELKS